LKTDWITHSAYQIAFYKNEFNNETNTITAFFKRRDSGKTLKITLNLEEVNYSDRFVAKFKIFELKYETSAVDTDCEVFFNKSVQNLTFERKNFFRLPAVEVHFKSQKVDNDSLVVEALGAFASYGLYTQELQLHRSIWGTSESHHMTEPGVQVNTANFATISLIGSLTNLFVQYLTSGEDVLIPGAPTTSRIEWNDLWGRRFGRPVVSVCPEVPSISTNLQELQQSGSTYAYRNFMLQTTYELLSPQTGERKFD